MKKLFIVLITLVCVATMSLIEIQKLDNQIKWKMVKIVKELNRGIKQ